MSNIHFANGGLEIVSSDFHTYNIPTMSEENLALVSRKCLSIIRTTGHEQQTAAAKTMLQLISDEKAFRASKIANDISQKDQDLASKRDIVTGRLTTALFVVTAVSAIGTLIQAFIAYQNFKITTRPDCGDQAPTIDSR